MIFLGIETSCDETAAAVVRDGHQVLASLVTSQVDLHRRYGGVVPEIACRAHLEVLQPLLQEALSRAGASPQEVDAVAVTRGPGLIGALLMGLTAAKTLAWLWRRPLVAVNHVQAHLYAAAMENATVEYPLVGLVVSGGHTLLCRADSHTQFSVVGSTVDDAAGEAFDKVAAILGLGYPGGPAIDRVARSGNPRAVHFPRASLEGRPFDFSFSGLKTAVLYHYRGQNSKGSGPVLLTPQEVADVAASFQEAVVDVLVERTLSAAGSLGVRTLVVGGGVAANSRLRARLERAAAVHGLVPVFPSVPMCLDNAAMVAGLGFHILREGRRASLDVDAFAQLTRSPQVAED